jgi:hypothetical protein
VHTYLSDRLFVAVAKRLGVPQQRLMRLQGRQRRSIREGTSISLFTTARLEGWLDEGASGMFLEYARQVIARRPEYAGEVYEAAVEPQAVTAEWVPDEVGAKDRLEGFGSSDDLIELDDLGPPPKVDDLMLLLGAAAPPSPTPKRNRRRSRFASDDLLPTVDAVGESFAQHLESQVDAYTSSSEQRSPLAEQELVEQEEVDELLGLLGAPPETEPLARDSALFEIDWEDEIQSLALGAPTPGAGEYDELGGEQAPLDWLGDADGYDPFGPPLGRQERQHAPPGLRAG